MAFSLVAVLAFLGMVFTRTSLDRSAIELAGLSQSVADQRSLNQRLRLEVARLESPARIAPLAEQLGMVYPQTSGRLVVEGVIPATVADPHWSEMDRFAAPTSSGPTSSAIRPGG
ncbi:MAG: hypothetical protein ACT4OP_10085 [Actinomycetota bacterium]